MTLLAELNWALNWPLYLIFILPAAFIGLFLYVVISAYATCIAALITFWDTRFSPYLEIVLGQVLIWAGPVFVILMLRLWVHMVFSQQGV